MLHFLPNLRESLTSSEIDRVLANLDRGDTILLQNEINYLAKIIEKSRARGLLIVFNPAPFDPSIRGDFPLDKVDFLILNETEGCGLTDERDPQEIVNKL